MSEIHHDALASLDADNTAHHPTHEDQSYRYLPLGGLILDREHIITLIDHRSRLLAPDIEIVFASERLAPLLIQDQADQEILLDWYLHARPSTHDVLTGANADPGLLGEVLTFDRCVLHACWELVHEPEVDPDPEMLFGPLSHLGDSTLLIHAVEMLQRNLVSCARQEEALRARLSARPWQVVRLGNMSYERSRQVIQDEASHQEAIALVNRLCFEAHGYALRMNWQCFDELFSKQEQVAHPARLYCLHLLFTPWTEVLADITPWIDPEMLPACEIRLPRAVWFLFPRGIDTTLLEASWQLFLLSWARCAEISYEGSLSSPGNPLQDRREAQRALSSEDTKGGNGNTMGGTV